MYKNILHDPMRATDEEIEAVDHRRTMEKNLILDRDNEDKDETAWYMISSEWLYSWKCFISNKVYPSEYMTQEMED